MSGFQFIHLESYARSPSAKSKEARRSVSEIIDEAARDTPSALPHVRAARPAEVLFGLDPREVEREAVELGDRATDARGRRLRKDAGVLLAGVASCPLPPGDDRVAAWEVDTLSFLRGEFGDRLRSVIRHVDERHAHVHFLIVPGVKDDGTMERLHPGEAARDQALAASVSRKAKGSKTLGDQAYRDAMRGFQDRFFEAVGVRQGLARLGPGRRRKSRSEWRAEQATNDAMASTIRRVEADRLEADRRQRELAAREEDLARERQDVERQKRIAEAVVLGTKAVHDGRIVGAVEDGDRRELLIGAHVDAPGRRSLIERLRPAWDYVWAYARDHAAAVRSGIERLLREAQARGDRDGTLSASKALHLADQLAKRAIRVRQDGQER